MATARLQSDPDPGGDHGPGPEHHPEKVLALFRAVYLIRAVEEKIRSVYPGDEMKTPVHLSEGAEAIEAGVCGALRRGDQVYGTYRTHGLYLATGGDLRRFFAELLGKETGIAGGRAGSMHLACPGTGFMMSSAIVGTILPVALGAAFAAVRRATGAVATVFFGDGATEEGVFWETLNMAALHSLPVLFVCEDNGLAIHVPRRHRQAYEIPQAPELFGIEAVSATGTDAIRVHALAAGMLARIRERRRPGFLHFTCHRYLEHVGIDEDWDAGYRRREDYAEWYADDPVDTGRRRVLEAGVGRACLDALVEEVDAAIETAYAEASADPMPAGTESAPGAAP